MAADRETHWCARDCEHVARALSMARRRVCNLVGTRILSVRIVMDFSSNKRIICHHFEVDLNIEGHSMV